MSPVEVFRSAGLIACEQRAFVLHAVGIPSEIADLPEGFVLFVAPDAMAAAREHIDRYDAEGTQVEPPQPLPVLHANAWLGPSLFALLIIGIAFLAGQSVGGFDWYESGALRAGVQRSGEWWRIATALTLHVDQAHLLGNLGFGAFFGYLAARLLGFGVAFGATIVAGIVGNLLDSVLMPASHVSMGASTMVFATLGLVSAYAWRLKVSARLRWANRSAPLVAGVMLLALIGAGGENTDVLAHLTGFGSGVAIGWLYSRWRNTFDTIATQGALAVTALSLVAAAWLWAAYAFSG